MGTVEIRREETESAANMIALLTKQNLAFTVELNNDWWIISITGY